MIEVNVNVKIEASAEILQFLQAILGQGGGNVTVDVAPPPPMAEEQAEDIVADAVADVALADAAPDDVEDVVADETIIMPPADYFRISPESPWNYARLLAGYMMKAQGRNQTEIFEALSAMPGAAIASADATGVRMAKLRRQIANYVPGATPKMAPLPVAAPVIAAPIVWSEARKLCLVKLRQIGTRWDAILKELNALPGPAIASRDAVKAQHATMAKRGVIPGMLQEKAAPAEQKWDGVTFDVVSHGQARQWAGQRGLVTHNEKLDIQKVNAKRVELGLAPFMIATAARARL